MKGRGGLRPHTYTEGDNQTDFSRTGASVAALGTVARAHTPVIHGVPIKGGKYDRTSPGSALAVEPSANNVLPVGTLYAKGCRYGYVIVPDENGPSITTIAAWETKLFFFRPVCPRPAFCAALLTVAGINIAYWSTWTTRTASIWSPWSSSFLSRPPIPRHEPGKRCVCWKSV